MNTDKQVSWTNMIVGGKGKIGIVLGQILNDPSIKKLEREAPGRKYLTVNILYISTNSKLRFQSLCAEFDNTQDYKN